METMNKLITLISNEINADMRNNTTRGKLIFPTILAAYNIYKEDTHDGVDYIFNITDNNDVICCLKCGDTTTMAELAEIFNKENCTPFFMFGQNYDKPKVFKNIEELKEKLISEMKYIITHIFIFRNTTDIYQTIINEYVGTLFNIQTETYKA